MWKASKKNVRMGVGHAGGARQARGGVRELLRRAEVRAATVVRKFRKAQLNTTESKEQASADSKVEKDLNSR